MSAKPHIDLAEDGYGALGREVGTAPTATTYKQIIASQQDEILRLRAQVEALLKVKEAAAAYWEFDQRELYIDLGLQLDRYEDWEKTHGTD